MKEQDLMNDIKEIETKIAELTQSKNDSEKALQDKKAQLETLLSSESLKNNFGGPAKIVTIKKDIEGLKASLKEINFTLPGLAARKDQTEQDLKNSQVEHLTKKLHENDLTILTILKEKLILIQKAVDLEKEIRRLFDEIGMDKHNLSLMGAEITPKSHNIPNNIWQMDVTTELIRKFLPFDDQSLKDEIDRIDKILKEK